MPGVTSTFYPCILGVTVESGHTMPSQGGAGGLPEGTTPEMIPAKDEINIPMLYDKTLKVLQRALAQHDPAVPPLDSWRRSRFQY